MMKNEKCYLIKDLLPNYIDELCAEETNEIIKKHLEECPDCKRSYDFMKGDIPGEREFKNTAEYDRSLMEKVSRDVKRKSEKSKYTAIIVVAVLIALFILLNLPIIPISAKDLSAKVVNPPYSLGTEWKKYNEIPERSVMLFDDDKKMEECVFRKVLFGDEYENSEIFKDIEVYVDSEYDPGQISIIELDSKKTIKAYKSGVMDTKSGYVFVVKGVRTSILGSFSGKSTSKVTFLEFNKIDGVFLDRGELKALDR